jgi:hypothetical protein
MSWKGAYSRRLQKRAAERGRKMARARWDQDRERRRALAALTAEQCPSHIVRRIVVIEHETTVREVVIWSFDSIRTARRKERDALRQRRGV